MSHVTTTARLCGALDALTKLGLDAPFIRQKLRDPEIDLGAEKRMQEAWLDMDTEPGTVGEESSLAVPNKTAESVGSFDANRDLPLYDRDRKRKDAIDRAFTINENIDNSTCPEPAGKMAAAANPFSVGKSLKTSIQGPRNAMNQISPFKAPKPPMPMDPRSSKPPGMNMQHDLLTNAATADLNTSWGSPQKRMQGYPGV